MISALALLLLSSIQAAQASDVWTVNCGVLSVQRSDPIVSPGVPSAHVHSIVGGTAFNRTMTGINAAVNSKKTTCDKFTDHSNYWAPQLYHEKDGMFQLVPFMGANMYYKRFTCDYDPNNRWCPTPANAKPFPPGLRMLAGDPDRRTQNNSDQTNQAILFESGNSGEMYGFPKTLANNVQMNVRFPSCWDGVNVDSPDHKSHMAYPDPAKGDTMGGMCPQSHPVALFHIGAEFSWDTASLGLTDSSGLIFSSGDTTGYGGHGDFVQGWTDLTALGNSFNNCNGIGTGCAWNSFGTPDGSMGVKSTLNPEIMPVVEEIGQNGPLSALPGDNPVGGLEGNVGGESTVAAVSTPAVTKVAAITTPAAVQAVQSTLVTIYVTKVVTKSAAATGCGRN